MPEGDLTPGQQVPLEPVTPGEQVILDPAQTPPVETPPVTPPVTPPAVVPDPGAVTDEKRLGGAILKIEELTIANRALVSDLAARDLKIEQLGVQLGQVGIEKTVAVGERDKNLEAVITEKQALDTEVIALRAYKMKVETAAKLGAPELITLIDRIPDMVDQEALETVMNDFLGFRQDGIKERETALLAGVTPPAPPIQNVPTTPTTDKAWSEYCNSLPLGSPERMKAQDDWFVWQNEQAAAK